MANASTIHHEVALANAAAEVTRLYKHKHDANFISIESYLAWMPDEDVLQIFQAVGKLPHLHTFRISFSFQRFRQLPVLPIPFQALEAVLDSARQLQTMTLDEVRFLFRSGQDLLTLARALKDKTKRLKHLTLFNCFPVVAEDPTTTTPTREDETAATSLVRNSAATSTSTLHVKIINNPLVSLANALATIPALVELNIIFTVEQRESGNREGPDDWIASLLRESCRSKSMQILRINVPDGTLLGDPMECMGCALETNDTLQELSIRCPLDAAGGKALAKALQSKVSRLTQLYIQLQRYDFAIPIAHALATNTSLKSFEVRVWTGGDRGPLHQAYETMLDTNCVLEELIIDNGRHVLTPKINFFLTLNGAGRRQFLERGETLDKHVWMDILTNFLHLGKDDDKTSALFYILSLNPSLCGAPCKRRTRRHPIPIESSIHTLDTTRSTNQTTTLHSTTVVGKGVSCDGQRQTKRSKLK